MKRRLISAVASCALALAAGATEYFATPDAVDDAAQDCRTEATAGSITNAFARATADGDVVTLLPGATGVYELTNYTPRVNTKIVNNANASYLLGNKKVIVRSKAEDPATVTLRGGGTSVDGRCLCLGAAAEIRGLTITNFYTSGSAAAVYSTVRTLLVSNCVVNGNRSAMTPGALYKLKAVDSTFTGNHSAVYGGIGENIDLVHCNLLYNGCAGNSWGGNGCVLRSSTLTRCTLGPGPFGYYQNYTSNGHVYDSTLTNCTVRGTTGATAPLLSSCKVYDTVFDGNFVKSGICGIAYQSTLYQCDFTSNTNNGSGASCVQASKCYDCLFSGNLTKNIAYYGGGTGKGGSFYNCRFYRNSASDYIPCGGALNANKSNPVYASNCVFVANCAESGGAVYGEAAQYALVVDSFFTNNYVWSGLAGCLYRVTISNCVVYGSCVKTSGKYGGAGYQCIAYDSLFENNELTNYWYSVAGGGALADGAAVNCVFKGNKDVGTSAAAACFNVAMTNCLVYGNTTIEGSYGGCVVYAGVPCVNCTIVSNKTASSCAACAGAFVNCIIAGNTPYDVWTRSSAGDKLATGLTNCVYGTAKPKALPDDVADSRQVASVEAVRFVSCDYPAAEAFQLRRRSPARDFGRDVGLGRADRDCVGRPRVFGRAIDAGCYELSFPLGLCVHLR